MTTETTCEVTRDEKPCGKPIERKVLTPWGTVRYVCAECARDYATIAGCLVKPLVEPPPGYICWCGGAPAKLYTVEGFHYTLCAVHRPVDLNVLWKRLWARIVFRVKRLFFPPKQMTTAEVQDLVEQARRRAKS
jgi:hypothetical protein